MQRMMAAAAVVLPLVLFCPATSHAERARSVELVVISADRDQLTNGSASVNCDAGEGQCSFTRLDDGTLTPAATFTLDTAGTDGDTPSVVWLIDSGPITSCVNFNYGISPDACM